MSKENRCSFCNRPAEEVNQLIQGPGVFICDDCVRYCHEIVDETGENKGSDKPSFLDRDLPAPMEIKKKLDDVTNELITEDDLIWAGIQKVLLPNQSLF